MAFMNRLLITLLGLAFALLFTLGVLCWLVVYAVFALVRWMFTGQKPQVVMMWQQVQAMRKSMQSGQGPIQRPDTTSDVVEDVVVREVHDKRFLPKD
jgi:hypothetical protein